MSKIILKSNVLVDNYTEYVCDKYDLQTREEIITEVPYLDINEISDFASRSFERIAIGLFVLFILPLP